jgi:hypothetical protein
MKKQHDFMPFGLLINNQTTPRNTFKSQNIRTKSHQSCLEITESFYLFD